MPCVFLSYFKPRGVSSFKALFQIKAFYKTKNIGHLGTLDPEADGILPVAVGSATRLIPYCKTTPKGYLVTIFFGLSTPTIDSEGVDLNNLPQIAQSFSSQEFELVLSNFIGEIDQVPPNFSAIKVNGVRSYKRARENEDFSLPSRKVTVYDLKLVEFDWPRIQVSIRCGSGFYVRSLVSDLSKKLNVPAFMLSLTRTACGSFNQENVVFDADFAANEVCEVPHDQILQDYYRVNLTDEQYSDIRNGKRIDIVGVLPKQPMVYAYFHDNLVSVLKREGNEFIILRNLNID